MPSIPSDTPQAALAAGLQLLERGAHDEALQHLDGVDVRALPPEEALRARAVTLQLALQLERFDVALRQAEAALDAFDEEPMLYHMAGHALLATGRERAGADALVYAAELLQRLTTPPLLPVNEKQVFYVAGEVCEGYELYDEARHFYGQAHRRAA